MHTVHRNGLCGRCLLAQRAVRFDRWKLLTRASTPDQNLGEGTRTELIRWFRQQLAKCSKEHHGTWAAAAVALGCDEKTLREDSTVPDTENF